MSDNTAGSVNIDIAGNLAPFEAALAKARQMANAFDAEVSKKLSGSSAAEAGVAKIAAAVEQTNAMLAKLTGAATPAAAAVSKLSTESAKASSAVTGVGTSSAAAAASVSKLGVDTNTAAASIQRAVAANQSFAASNLQMANGTAARAADIQAYGAALDDIRAKYNPLFRVTREYLVLKEELRLATRLGAITTDEAATALSRERQATLASIAVLKSHGGATRLAAYEVRNLKFQLIDIAQSIPLAFQSPLYFMQNLGFQLAQIGQIFMGQGGLRAAISTIGSSIGGVVARIAGLVAGSVGLRALGTAGIAASLGFEAIRDAASEAEHRTVGFGETFTAIFQTLGNYISNSAIGTVFGKITSGVSYAFQQLGSAAVDIAELVINAFHAAGYDIVAYWKSFPAQLGLIFGEAANLAIVPINYLVKKSGDAVDEIIAAWNRLTGSEIKPINAPDQIIQGFDTSKLRAQLTQVIEDRNKAVDDIMASHPLRSFASDVVDQISANKALEGLDSLAGISFDNATRSANGFSSAVGGIGKAANGVTVEFGGVSQEVINVSRAFEDAKRSQLIGLQQSTMQLQEMKFQAQDIQKTLDAANMAPIDKVFGEAFTGNAAAASEAIDRTVNSIDRLFSALDTGNIPLSSFYDSLELVRQSLLQVGGDPRAVNAFINSIINGELKVRELKSGVDSLSQSIRNIPNRTVTITVKTQQVGSGTQSQYSVPNSSGGYSNVGVTRYGAAPGSQSGPSISASTVPRTGGYGSMGGSGDLGSTTVNVTRFATGGMIHPGDTQEVSFFKSPQETVGIFTPQQMSALQGAAPLAHAQSGFTGREATREMDRIWTVLMNIEANTRKTYEGIDKWVATGGSSSAYSGGSSSDGSSGGYDTETDQLRKQYYQALKTIRSNFAAAGIVGEGSVGYGGQGLATSPERIAHNLVYGGQSQLGGAGANTYEKTLADTTAQHAYIESERVKAGGLNYGFATGGVMGPGNGDTQKVEFFKNPNERVIIARPDQYADVRADKASDTAQEQRPIVHQYLTVRSDGAPPSRESLASIKQASAFGVQQALKEYRGRG